MTQALVRLADDFEIRSPDNSGYYPYCDVRVPILQPRYEDVKKMLESEQGWVEIPQAKANSLHYEYLFLKSIFLRHTEMTDGFLRCKLEGVINPDLTKHVTFYGFTSVDEVAIFFESDFYKTNLPAGQFQYVSMIKAFTDSHDFLSLETGDVIYLQDLQNRFNFEFMGRELKPTLAVSAMNGMTDEILNRESILGFICAIRGRKI